MLVGARNEQARQPAERRIAGLLAQLDLGGVERLAVLRDQRAHHRMLRLMRLQKADAAALLAAGAADHLMQQLERALGGARIAVGKPEIGIDDADQIELGKMMPLGDELRADDDVEAALRHVVELLRAAARPIRPDRWTAPGCARPETARPPPAPAARRRDRPATKLPFASHFGHCSGGGIEKPQ